MSDERTAGLVVKCQQGDPEAIAQLLELYGNMAYRVISNLLYPSPDIDDVYQEACVQVFTGIRSLREPERFAGWFKRIAIGKAVDHLRRTAPTLMGTAQDLDSIECVSCNADQEMDHLTVRQAVAALPLHYKAVVILFYWSNCSYAEIAVALNIPQGTVMSRLNKAKRMLASKLGSAGEQEGGLYGF